MWARFVYFPFSYIEHMVVYNNLHHHFTGYELATIRLCRTSLRMINLKHSQFEVLEIDQISGTGVLQSAEHKSLNAYCILLAELTVFSGP